MIRSGFAVSGVLLLLALVAIVAVVMALVVRSRTARRIVGVVVLAGVVLLGLLLVSRPVRHRHVRRSAVSVRTPRNVPVVPVTPSLPAEAPAPQVWIDAQSEDFVADVYPSPRLAAAALAVRVAGRLASATPPDGKPATVTVVAGGANQAVLDAVLETLHAKSDVEQVRLDTATQPAGQDDTADGKAILQVIVNENKPSRIVPGLGTPVAEGTVTLRLSGPAGTASFTGAYVTKAWLDNFALFASAQQQGRRWILGRCDRPCTTQHEAEQQALRNAAEAMLDHLLQTESYRRVAGTGRVDPAWARDRIAHSLSPYVRDQFVQSFDRPYGQLWQQAVLVDASPTTIDRLARDLAAAAGSRRVTLLWGWGRRVLSVAAVVGVVLLAYLFLNAATKGYYEWALRVAGAALVAGGLVLALIVL